MDDAPDAAFAILFEDGSDLLGARQVALDGVDSCAVLVCVRRVLGQYVSCELRDTCECGRVRVVVVVDRDHLVSPRLLQGKDDMRA